MMTSTRPAIAVDKSRFAHGGIYHALFDRHLRDFWDSGGCPCHGVDRAAFDVLARVS